MAYVGKTNWQLNEIVKPEDMNHIEQGIIDAHESLLTHNASANAHKNRFDEFVKGVTGSNATLTITKGNGTTSAVTVNNVANATNATNATKATQDSTGQQINSTYIKGLSASNATLTYTKGNGTTGTVTVNNVANAGTANKLSSENGNHYLTINTTKDSWDVLGSNHGRWLKSIRTSTYAPPYSIGNYSAAIAFGGEDTKGIITNAYETPSVKFAGGNGEVPNWKFTIYGGYNNETYDLNNFPTKTGGGASGTWGINVSGNSATATNADKLDGYHASDIINKISASNTGGIVAESLTSPGYVKFANGFIIQWGFVYVDGAPGTDNIASYHKYWTYPIKMSVPIGALATDMSGNFTDPQPFCIWGAGGPYSLIINCQIARTAFVLAIGIA